MADLIEFVGKPKSVALFELEMMRIISGYPTALRAERAVRRQLFVDFRILGLPRT
jgi:hypothetical protein